MLSGKNTAKAVQYHLQHGHIELVERYPLNKNTARREPFSCPAELLHGKKIGAPDHIGMKEIADNHIVVRRIAAQKAPRIIAQHTHVGHHAAIHRCKRSGCSSNRPSRQFHSSALQSVKRKRAGSRDSRTKPEKQDRTGLRMQEQRKSCLILLHGDGCRITGCIHTLQIREQKPLPGWLFNHMRQSHGILVERQIMRCRQRR